MSSVTGLVSLSSIRSDDFEAILTDRTQTCHCSLSASVTIQTALLFLVRGKRAGFRCIDRRTRSRRWENRVRGHALLMRGRMVKWSIQEGIGRIVGTWVRWKYCWLRGRWKPRILILFESAAQLFVDMIRSLPICIDQLITVFCLLRRRMMMMMIRLRASLNRVGSLDCLVRRKISVPVFIETDQVLVLLTRSQRTEHEESSELLNQQSLSRNVCAGDKHNNVLDVQVRWFEKDSPPHPASREVEDSLWARGDADRWDAGDGLLIQRRRRSENTADCSLRWSFETHCVDDQEVSMKGVEVEVEVLAAVAVVVHLDQRQ